MYSVCSTSMNVISCPSNITLDPGYCDNTTLNLTDEFVVEFDVRMIAIDKTYIHIFDIGNDFFVRYNKDVGISRFYLRYTLTDGTLSDALYPLNQTIEIDTDYYHKISVTQTNLTWEINGIYKLNARKQQHRIGEVGELCFPQLNTQNSVSSADRGVISNLKLIKITPTTEPTTNPTSDPTTGPTIPPTEYPTELQPTTSFPTTATPITTGFLYAF